MLIKIEQNEDIVTYQYDDSAQGNLPIADKDTSTAQGIAESLFSGLPTTGICTDTIRLDHTLYLNLNSFSEVRIIENFENYYSLSTDLTHDCTKIIVLGLGLQSTILAFNKVSEGEFQRIKREIDELYLAGK